MKMKKFMTVSIVILYFVFSSLAQEPVAATVQSKSQIKTQTTQLTNQSNTQQTQYSDSAQIKNQQTHEQKPQPNIKPFQHTPTLQQLQLQAQKKPVKSQVQLLNEGINDQKNVYIDQLQQNIISKQQKQQQQKELEKQNKKLHQWVIDQLQALKKDDIRTHQIFSFKLDKQLDFNWNPTEFKSGPLRFIVEVFKNQGGAVTFPKNPDQDNYVEVLTQSQRQYTFTNLGKLYIKKVFTINFFSDYQIIQFKNHYGDDILVQISLQATKFVPEKALDDDQLKIPAQKIASILQQLQQTQTKREKTYRSEWSFKDRQQHHQSQMLILTGVELIIILGTAIVQMYCIKNLFDSRLIV